MKKKEAGRKKSEEKRGRLREETPGRSQGWGEHG